MGNKCSLIGNPDVGAKKLGSLTYGTYTQRTHILRFLERLYGLGSMQFLYIIIFLDSLLEVLQEFPTLKKIYHLRLE
jgi:hypothetical protein